MENISKSSETLETIKNRLQNGGGSEDPLTNVIEEIDSFLNTLPANEHQKCLSDILPMLLQKIPHFTDALQKETASFIKRRFDATIEDSSQEAHENLLGINAADYRAALEKTMTDALTTMEVRWRERVCEVFHVYWGKEEKSPARRTVGRSIQQKSSETLGLSQRLGRILRPESIETQCMEAMQEQLRKIFSGRGNVFIRSGIMEPEKAITASLLQAADTVFKSFDIEREMGNKLLSCLIRSTAEELTKEEYWSESKLEGDKKRDLMDRLSTLSKHFYPRVENTLKVWDELNSTLVGNSTAEAKFCMIIDCEDMAAMHTLGIAVTDNPYLIFTYDREPGYANGVVNILQKGMKIAEENAPLSIDDIKSFNDCLLQANPHGGYDFSKEAVGFEIEDGGNITPAGFLEMESFARDFTSFVEEEMGEQEKEVIYLRRGRGVASSDLLYPRKGETTVYGRVEIPVKVLETGMKRALDKFNQGLSSLTTEDEVVDLALRLNKDLELMHASHDGNCRKFGNVYLNVAIVKGLRELGVKPWLMVLDNPNKIDMYSLKQLRQIVYQGRDFVRGEITLAQMPALAKIYTENEIKSVNEKFPRGESRVGWIIKRPAFDREIELTVQQKNFNRNDPTALETVIFHYGEPPRICKLHSDEIPDETLEEIKNGTEKVAFKALNTEMEKVEFQLDLRLLEKRNHSSAKYLAQANGLLTSETIQAFEQKRQVWQEWLANKEALVSLADSLGKRDSDGAREKRRELQESLKLTDTQSDQTVSVITFKELSKGLKDVLVNSQNELSRFYLYIRKASMEARIKSLSAQEDTSSVRLPEQPSISGPARDATQAGHRDTPSPEAVASQPAQNEPVRESTPDPQPPVSPLPASSTQQQITTAGANLLPDDLKEILRVPATAAGGNVDDCTLTTPGSNSRIKDYFSGMLLIQTGERPDEQKCYFLDRHKRNTIIEASRAELGDRRWDDLSTLLNNPSRNRKKMFSVYVQGREPRYQQPTESSKNKRQRH